MIITLNDWNIYIKEWNSAGANSASVTDPVSSVKDTINNGGIPNDQNRKDKESQLKKFGFMTKQKNNDSYTMITNLKDWKKSKLNENATITEQDELNAVQRWVEKSGMDFDDWDWDGETLTIFVGEGTEKYSRADLKEVGVTLADVDPGKAVPVESTPEDDLKSNFRSWESDHDNEDDANGLFSILMTRHPKENEAKLRKLAFDWVGYEEVTEDAHLQMKENAKSVCCHAPVYMEGSTSMCCTCKRPCECVPVTEEAPEMAEKMSDKAKDFIDNKIKFLIDKEGKKQKQAIAIAYSMAKKKGFDVPNKKHETKVAGINEVKFTDELVSDIKNLLDTKNYKSKLTSQDIMSALDDVKNSLNKPKTQSAAI